MVNNVQKTVHVVNGCPILDRDQSKLQGSEEVMEALHFGVCVGIEGVGPCD